MKQHLLSNIRLAIADHRFFSASAFSGLLQYLVYFSITYVSSSWYLVANMLGFIVYVTSHQILISRWVYVQDTAPFPMRSYVAVQVILQVLVIGGHWIAVYVFGMTHWVPYIALNLLSAVANWKLCSRLLT